MIDNDISKKNQKSEQTNDQASERIKAIDDVEVNYNNIVNETLFVISTTRYYKAALHEERWLIGKRKGESYL